MKTMQEIYQAISKGELKRNSAQDPKREIKSVFIRSDHGSQAKG